jgi:hypothetical protein
VAQKHFSPIKSLEQMVEEYPHVQFFRDMLGMRQDAIREREVHFEQHWYHIGADLQISTAGGHRVPSRQGRV